MAPPGLDVKENRPNGLGNVGNDAPAGDEKGPHKASGQIREEADSVGQFMEWWGTGQGQALASRHSILSTVEPSQLAEVVSAGSGYHMILTLDRLDALQRKVGGITDPALEPLRSALRAGGGAKGQARVVGSLLFREARGVWSNACSGNSPSPAGPASTVAHAEGAHIIDEEWNVPRTFVCSQHWPSGATIAARSAPSKEGKMLTAFPEGMEFRATARSGEYLRIHVDDGTGNCVMWVPYIIGGLELLVLSPSDAAALAAAPQAFAVPSALLQASPRPCPASPGPAPAPQQAVQAFAGSQLQDGRLLALEQRVAQQDARISHLDNQNQALQNEVGFLRSHICAIAGAFKPLAETTWSR